MLNADEIKAVMENRFSIDCPKLILNPQSPNSSGKIYEGSGFVTQNRDGSLSLKMFCGGSLAPEEFFSKLQFPPGKIIEEQHYYRLSATDISGREWESKWILPNFNVGPEFVGYVINSGIREIWYADSIPKATEARYAELYIPGDVQIPFSNTTQIERIVEGERRSSATLLNISKFISNGYKFEIEQKDSWILFRVISHDHDINKATLIRFMEALQFVLAKSISWTISSLIHEHTVVTHIKSHNDMYCRSRIGPPIHFQLTDRSSIWHLFDKYLSYVINYNEKSWHPVFGWVHAVIESGCSSVDTESLVLSIAIEGLLKDNFSSLVYDISQLEQHVSKTQCIITHSDLDANFKNRILGTLGAMLRPRPKDLLHILKDRALIDPVLISAYDKMWNSSAHGEVADISKLQIHLDRCSAVLTLFYQLIFLAIGYTGPYADYSTPGFPTREIKASLA